MFGAWGLRRRPESAVSYAVRVVVLGDPVLREDSLHEGSPRGDRQGFPVMGVVGDFGEDVSLVIRIVIIAVDYSYRIVQLEAILEPQPASRIERQQPPLRYAHADPRGDFRGLAGGEGYLERRKEVISRRAGCRAAREPDVLVDFLAVGTGAAVLELREAHPLEFRDFSHKIPLSCFS